MHYLKTFLEDLDYICVNDIEKLPVYGLQCTEGRMRRVDKGMV